MRRREFIGLLGGAAAWPLTARAQQGERMRLIGLLMGYAESDPEGQPPFAAFREGLQKLGWAEGRNIRIDTRWAASDVESMQRFAKELVALQPDLILSHTTPATAALLQQTRTIRRRARSSRRCRSLGSSTPGHARWLPSALPRSAAASMKPATSKTKT